MNENVDNSRIQAARPAVARRRPRTMALKRAFLYIFTFSVFSIFSGKIVDLANGRGSLPVSVGRGMPDADGTPNAADETVNSVKKPDNTIVDIDISYNMSLPYMEELVGLIEEYPKAAVIIQEKEKYPDEIVELFIKNNETLDFVINYPDAAAEAFIYHEPSSAIDIVDVFAEVEKGVIPHFVQWDSRWGYSYYGGEIMGIDGCGPTSLAMVAAGLTGDPKFTPPYIADFSVKNGYITADNKTKWTLMSEGSKKLGLVPQELILDANAIKSALRRGEPIIASMGPGDFTTVGHFLVLVGVTDTGKILVNDSFSYINTSKEWDVETLMSQMKNLWSFKVKGL